MHDIAILILIVVVIAVVILASLLFTNRAIQLNSNRDDGMTTKLREQFATLVQETNNLSVQIAQIEEKLAEQGKAIASLKVENDILKAKLTLPSQRVLLKQLPPEDLKTWFKAAYNGDLEQARLLIEKGIDCNVKNKNGSLLYGDKQFTALHYCAKYGYKTLGQLLLDNEARVDERTRDEHDPTSLMTACANGKIEMVELLVSHGADVNAKDSNGWTPLTHATRWGYEEIVRFLSNDPTLNTLNHRDSLNKTALQRAIDNKHDKISEFLKSKDATV